MKKILLVGLLVCAILTSVVAGTLALYSVQLDDITGDVTAKTFGITAEDPNKTFTDDLKMAPTESHTYKVEVTNKSAGIAYSEVDIEVTVSMVITVKTGDKTLTVPLTIDDAEQKFTLKGGSETSHVFTFVVNWPNGTKDTQYLGTTWEVRASISGVQVA